jgi:hypothetical protein
LRYSCLWIGTGQWNTTEQEVSNIVAGFFGFGVQSLKVGSADFAR